MGLAAIIEIIKGIFQFPDALLRLIQVLRKTPSERHEDIIKRIEGEALKFEDTGRPTWD